MELQRRRPLPLIEMALAAFILVGVALVFNRLIIDGMLPQPFIFDVNDTFMDFFNTAYWAHHPGAFDVWRTVYPPLSFIFLKLTTIGRCYGSSPVAARDCDWLGRFVIIVSAFGCMVTAALAFRRNDPTTVGPRALGFALGLPLLFALERGNLLMVAFPFFAAAYGGLARSRWSRALAAAVTINFKPYLVLPAFAWAIRRDWRVLELAGIATILLYILMWAALGAGSFTELASNTANWLQFLSGYVYEAIYYSTSFAPFAQVDTAALPARDFVGSQVVEAISFAVPVAIRASQLLAALALGAAALRPRAITSQRLAVLFIGIYLVSQSPGGYAALFLVFLIFLERWQRPGPIIAITAAYLMSFPYDRVFGIFFELPNTSWLTHRTVEASFGLSVGIFARPALVLVAFWALALDTLALTWAARPARAARLPAAAA